MPFLEKWTIFLLIKCLGHISPLLQKVLPPYCWQGKSICPFHLKDQKCTGPSLGLEKVPQTPNLQCAKQSARLLSGSFLNKFPHSLILEKEKGKVGRTRRGANFSGFAVCWWNTGSQSFYYIIFRYKQYVCKLFEKALRPPYYGRCFILLQSESSIKFPTLNLDFFVAKIDAMDFS